MNKEELTQVIHHELAKAFRPSALARSTSRPSDYEIRMADTLATLAYSADILDDVGKALRRAARKAKVQS